MLHNLLQKSGKFELWGKFDRVIQTFVGRPDSMTFAQLGAVLASANIRGPADVKDADALSALGVRIGASDFGAQEPVPLRAVENYRSQRNAEERAATAEAG